VRVCPTQATWKREDGIVAMDWHRCIGCRYLHGGLPLWFAQLQWMDPRPYIHNPTPEFPTRTKGVVEKCTFCTERLVVGRLPVCVEVCPREGVGLRQPGRSPFADPRVAGYAASYPAKARAGNGPNVFYIV